MNSPASGSSSPYNRLRVRMTKQRLSFNNVPVLPHIQRVMPCSSSSGASSGKFPIRPVAPSFETSISCLFSFGFRLFLPLLVLWAELPEGVEAGESFLRSSGGSSYSSCLRRFCLPPLLLDARGGRGGASFCLGAGSESGDLEALVEVEGIERRPERRGSLGESGGPIAAACAIIPRDFWDDEMYLNTGRTQSTGCHNKTLSVRPVFGHASNSTCLLLLVTIIILGQTLQPSLSNLHPSLKNAAL